jgi:hypothetical protein
VWNAPVPQEVLSFMLEEAENEAEEVLEEVTEA